MKIVVVNTKGGVGKSAFSMQLVAPYLLSRFGNASLFEIDDYNFDASDYTKSGVSCNSVYVGSEPDRALESLRMNMSGKHCVIDVGGNETAGAFMKAAGANHLARTIDAVIIPVTQTGKDVENAGKTFEMVKEQFKGYAGKVLFGVTRIPSDYGYDDLVYRLPDLMELAEGTGADGVITLPNDTSIPMSRMMGLTAWELAVFSDDHVDRIQDEMIAEEEKGEEADVKKLRTLNRYTVAIESAIRLRPHLEERFDQMDDILGVTPEMRVNGLTPVKQGLVETSDEA